MYGEDPPTREKRRTKLTALRKLSIIANVLLLQETHITESSQLSSLFPDFHVFTNPNALGTTTLIHKKLKGDFSLETCELEEWGLGVTLCLQNEPYLQLINIYLPSGAGLEKSKMKILTSLSENVVAPTIIGGDWSFLETNLDSDPPRDLHKGLTSFFSQWRKDLDMRELYQAEMTCVSR